MKSKTLFWFTFMIIGLFILGGCSKEVQKTIIHDENPKPVIHTDSPFQLDQKGEVTKIIIYYDVDDPVQTLISPDDDEVIAELTDILTQAVGFSGNTTNDLGISIQISYSNDVIQTLTSNGQSVFIDSLTKRSYTIQEPYEQRFEDFISKMKE